MVFCSGTLHGVLGFGDADSSKAEVIWKLRHGNSLRPVERSSRTCSALRCSFSNLLQGAEQLQREKYKPNRRKKRELTKEN